MRKNISFVLFIFILLGGLYLIYEKFNFNVALFDTSSAEKYPEKQSISGSILKVEETKKEPTVSIEEKLQYIYSYDKEKREMTFGLKNISTEDVTLNFDSEIQFDIHVSNMERNFLWKLSNENTIKKKGTRLIIGAGKEVKNTFTLPANLKEGNYTVTGFYNAKELEHKETLIEKIHVEKIEDTSENSNGINETNSEFSYGMIYSLKYNSSAKTMNIALINATDMPITLHFETDLLYTLSIFKGNEKITEIAHKGAEESTIINGDAKKSFDEKLSLPAGKYKGVLRVQAVETMEVGNVIVDFTVK